MATAARAHAEKIPGQLAASEPAQSAPAARRRFRPREAFAGDRAVLLLVTLPVALGLAAHARWSSRLFAPDSRYYLVMALRDAGYGPVDALRVQGKVTGFVAGPWFFDASDPIWRMVQPRLLYPLLSAPFVWAGGPRYGMLVVPAAAVLVTVVAVARLAQRLYGPVAALAAAGLLGASATVTTLAMALTDTLAMALIALLLLNLPIGQRLRGQHYVLLAFLSALMCMTRQTAPMVLAMVAGGLLWAVLPARRAEPRPRRQWLLAALVTGTATIGGQVLTELLVPYDATTQLLLATHQPSIPSALAHLPGMAWRISRAEGLLMAHTDAWLVALTLLSLLHVIRCSKAVETWLLLGGLIGVYGLMLSNGIPSLLRYECVLYPVAALCVGALVHRWLPEPLNRALPRPGRPEWWQGRRWRVPALAAACATACVAAAAWSAAFGSASLTNGVPTEPATSAALTRYAVSPPLAHPSTARILRDSLRCAEVRSCVLIGYLDWRHPVRYTPARPGDPGWARRGPDGSAVIRFGDYIELAPARVAAGLSLSGTVAPQSLALSSRTISADGEDVTFTVADRSGRVHRGWATVLYPTLAAPGMITRLVYAPGAPG